MGNRIVLLIGIVLLLASPVMAAPVFTTGTLADLIALGSVQIDDKLFSNFSYTGSGFGGATAVPASGVSVTALDTPFNPGLQFSAPWSVGPGQGLDSLIGFTVEVLPGGAPIKDISASMAGFGVVPDGVVTVAETTSVGNLFLHDNGGTVAFATISFAPTPGPITVAKDIAVNGNSGVAAVSSVTNRFSEVQVPEPGTLFLLGSGLVGVGVFGWRRHGK